MSSDEWLTVPLDGKAKPPEDYFIAFCYCIKELMHDLDVSPKISFKNVRLRTYCDQSAKMVLDLSDEKHLRSDFDISVLKL